MVKMQKKCACSLYLRSSEANITHSPNVACTPLMYLILPISGKADSLATVYTVLWLLKTAVVAL